ncbi:MAG TPA: hypothetical protein VGL03_01175 [Thermoanaerobaculia bacterium]|jgi:hypothetical protein
MNGASLFDETQGFATWVYLVPVLVMALLLSVLTVRQRTTVTPEAVTVRFGFLYRMRVPLSDIVRAEAVAYRPIRDYGGWGIRGWGRRRALNTRGNQGVLLTRMDGSTLLIGSQKPRDLLAALAAAGVHTEDRLPVVVRDF